MSLADRRLRNQGITRPLQRTPEAVVAWFGAVQAQTADFAILNNYRRFGNLCGQHCQIVNTHHSIEDQAIFPEISKQSEDRTSVSA